MAEISPLFNRDLKGLAGITMNLDYDSKRMNRLFFFNTLKNKNHDILTWIGEFRPGNKTIWVVFDEESDCSGPRTPKFSPDQVF